MTDNLRSALRGEGDLVGVCIHGKHVPSGSRAATSRSARTKGPARKAKAMAFRLPWVQKHKEQRGETIHPVLPEEDFLEEHRHAMMMGRIYELENRK